MGNAPDIKQKSAKRREQMGFENSVPRCETCRSFKKPKIYMTNNSITGSTIPFCVVGKFSVQRTDCCDMWVHKSTGQSIAAAPAAQGGGIDSIDDETVVALMLKATGEEYDEADAWKLRMFAQYMGARGVV